jgi:myo-inositol-1(or 4)-monophosphatase
MALVMHVEPMVHGMILELRYVSCDVDDRHSSNPTGPDGIPGGVRSLAVAADSSPEHSLAVLHDVVSAVAASLEGLDDWGLAGTREGQYRSDLIADEAALAVIDRAGLGALSEESGPHHSERPIWVVLDPVDGSTNASRGLPWWATSACALDGDGPLAAVVANQATGVRFEATRGGGARCDGRPIAPTSCQSMQQAIVALCGYPKWWLGWSQYRALGAAALDLCAVAAGQVDAFIDCAAQSLAPWDYLGGLLICREAGAVVEEAFGRDLVVREYGPRRTPVAAATPALLAEAVASRVGLEK